MTTDNEKGPLNQMESGQEKGSASEARALSEIVNGTPSENLCRRGSPATEQASETTAQQPRTYTTQPAESVMGIALRQCGNEMEWRHILACNPEFAHMLPHEYFPVGTVLNLPPHPAAASPVEQPEKSLAPEGGSEARGRWIQANCPTGDIIESPSPSNNREFPTSMSESDCEHRIALAPSQPAAAPIEYRYEGGTHWCDLGPAERMRPDFKGVYRLKAGTFPVWAGDPAPSPADERAAFEWPLLPLLPETVITTADGEAVFTAPQMQGYANAYGEMVRARAASASATGAEGALIERLKLLLSGDAAFCRTIVARAAIEQAIAILSRSPAMAAEAVAIVDESDDGLFVEILYGANGSPLKCGDKLYAAPQPAQADARVGLTDEQRDVLTWAIGRANSQGEDACADVLRSILASQPGRPVPRAEVTDAARAGEAS